MSGQRIRSGEGFVWVGIGCLVGLVGMQAGIGSASEPGSGFVALAAGIFMGLVGVAMAVAGFAGRRAKPEISLGEGTPQRTPLPWGRLVWVAGLLLAYALLLEHLGFLLTGLIILTGLFYDHKRKNLLSGALLALGISLVAYIIFVKLLLVRFPAGLLPLG